MTPDKIDNNQVSIVKVLRKIPGITVEVGHDDLLLGYKGKTYWFEIKNPDCVSKRTGKVLPSKIKPSQKKLLKTFTGHYSIVWKLEQILNQIGLEA